MSKHDTLNSFGVLLLDQLISTDDFKLFDHIGPNLDVLPISQITKYSYVDGISLSCNPPILYIELEARNQRQIRIEPCEHYSSTVDDEYIRLKFTDDIFNTYVTQGHIIVFVHNEVYPHTRVIVLSLSDGILKFHADMVSDLRFESSDDILGVGKDNNTGDDELYHYNLDCELIGKYQMLSNQFHVISKFGIIVFVLSYYHAYEIVLCDRDKQIQTINLCGDMKLLRGFNDKLVVHMFDEKIIYVYAF